MASLTTLLEKEFTSYLDDIGVPYRKTYKLSKLIDIIKQHNESYPERAIGVLTLKAIKTYEEQ